MDYANERWVRVYTRDTTTWKVLDWQARTVLLMMFRKCDRVGELDVDGRAERGLAAILELPIEIVKAGIVQLIDEKVVVVNARAYVIPNFLEAQEATQTPAHRSREYRDRKRAKALGQSDPEDETVTKRDANVTRRHAASRGVTPIRSNPIRIQPDEVSNGGGDPDSPARARSHQQTPTPLPDGWVPEPSPENAQASEEAKARGVAIPYALGKFREKRRGKLVNDWNQEWRLFLLTEFPTPQAIVEAMTRVEREQRAQAVRDRERETVAQIRQQRVDPEVAEENRRAAQAAMSNGFRLPAEEGKATG